MLVAAMNPCPCGHYGDDTRCVCNPPQVERYIGRMSGPLLDRIDIHIEVPPLSGACLTARHGGESSAAMRDRVLAARDRQLRRFGGASGTFANGDMTPAQLRTHCAVDAAGERLLRGAVQRLGLSARAYHRVLRVARTIADLDGADAIAVGHLAEAVQYRTLDRPRVRR